MLRQGRIGNSLSLACGKSRLQPWCTKASWRQCTSQQPVHTMPWAAGPVPALASPLCSCKASCLKRAFLRPTGPIREEGAQVHHPARVQVPEDVRTAGRRVDCPREKLLSRVDVISCLSVCPRSWVQIQMVIALYIIWVTPIRVVRRGVRAQGQGAGAASGACSGRARVGKGRCTRVYDA